MPSFEQARDLTTRHVCVPMLLCAVAPVSLSRAQTAWCFDPVRQTAQEPSLPRESRIVIDAARTAHVVLFDDSTSGGRGRMMYLSRIAGASSWSPAEIVADNASHVTTLSVADGAVYVTYAHEPDQSERVRWRPAPSGPWSDLVAVPSGNFVAGGMGGAALVGPTGLVQLAYFYGSSEDVRLTEQTVSGWVTTTVEPTDRVGKSMHIALTFDGRTLLGYYDQDRDRITVAERDTGGTWSIDQTAIVAAPFDIDALPGGGAVMTRITDTAPLSSFGIFIRSSGGWSQDTSVPTFPYNKARLTVDSAGTIHGAAWQDGGRLDYLRKPSGGAWQAETVTQGTGADGTRDADIALAPGGDPVFVITRADGMVVVAERCVIERFCVPDGGALLCPCGNYGAPPGGCENSLILGGGWMDWSGDAVVGADTLQFHVSGVPPTTACLLLQGDGIVTGGGYGVGDGVLCVAGPVVRLGMQTAARGVADFGAGISGSGPISILGSVQAGTTHYYQVWYRNSQVFCTSANYNLTSGAIVPWQ